MRGTIKKLLSDKGCGFLKGDDGADRFFHRSALLDVTFEQLQEGDKVSFEEEDGGQKGPRAGQVRLT